MSIPDNPGPDDELFASMREQLADIEVPVDENSVRTLSDLQLAEELARVRRQLLDLKELRHVKTERGRELHSRRSALTIELHRRSSP